MEEEEKRRGSLVSPRKELTTPANATPVLTGRPEGRSSRPDKAGPARQPEAAETEEGAEQE